MNRDLRRPPISEYGRPHSRARAELGDDTHIDAAFAGWSGDADASRGEHAHFGRSLGSERDLPDDALAAFGEILASDCDGSSASDSATRRAQTTTSATRAMTSEPAASLRVRPTTMTSEFCIMLYTRPYGSTHDHPEHGQDC